MTREEVLELYGEIPLPFSYYYKYLYYYKGIAPDGAVIYAGIGGDASDIYRYEVTRDKYLTLNEESGWVSAKVIKDQQVIWQEFNNPYW